MNSEGRLISPLKDAWGDGKTYSELIHTYCISPIKDAGRLLNRDDYITKAKMIEDYYTTNCLEQILNFDLLSHFYAYVMEAMLDIGRIDIAREAMNKVAILQKESGAVPAYNNVDWVCSTGLFQLAIVLFFVFVFVLVVQSPYGIHLRSISLISPFSMRTLVLSTVNSRL